MDFSLVTSKENKLIKSVRKLLTSAKERKQTGTFVLEGLRLSVDAALNGYTIETLIISDSTENSQIDVLIKSANEIVKVPDSLFSYISDTVTPQGVLCIVKLPDNKFNINNLPLGKYLFLENTSDPANLGTIARTAEALGINGLIVSNNGCDPFSPKCQRAGMGALLRIPVIKSDNVVSDLDLLKQRGFTLFATVVKNADCDVSKTAYPEATVVLIGNEANGLTDNVVSVCDKKVTITMQGRAESLNAASAASIVMWEMTRKEATK